MTKDSEVIEAAMKSKKPLRKEEGRVYLSTGLTLVNQGISGRPDGGVLAGTYVYYVGDSSSGKTVFALNLLGHAAIDPNFDEYDLVYDPTENGALIDVARYFGPRLASRLSDPPRGRSRTARDFYYNLDTLVRRGRPFIDVLDSMDALDTEEDEAKFLEGMEASDKGKEVAGSYGMAKAKLNSQNIKRYVSALAETGSILVVISQTRDKVNSPIPGQKTYAGGRALRFYAHVQLWTSVKGDIKVNRLGKERVIGSQIQVDVQKNRLTGWDGKLIVPFYRQHGFDDVGSCVDYLVDEGFWKKTKQTVSAPQFEFEGSREVLVKQIQDDGQEALLRSLVSERWDAVEEACAPQRKKFFEE